MATNTEFEQEREINNDGCVKSMDAVIYAKIDKVTEADFSEKTVIIGTKIIDEPVTAEKLMAVDIETVKDVKPVEFLDLLGTMFNKAYDTLFGSEE